MTYVISTYVKIQKLNNDKNYAKEKKLKVKKKENLVIIKYDKSKINTANQQTLGLFRSVIVNQKGEILCFAPPKSIDFDIFSQSTLYEQCTLKEFVEGTMINLFWVPSEKEWEIATRSNIGARCKFNLNETKTFRTMFLETMNH